jgi:hypothetical protein
MPQKWVHNLLAYMSASKVGVAVDSSVGIATCYGLNGQGIESRWGRDFRSVQSGPEAHPASFAMRTGSLFRGQNGRSVALTTHSHLAPRLKKE